LIGDKPKANMTIMLGIE